LIYCNRPILTEGGTFISLNNGIKGLVDHLIRP